MAKIFVLSGPDVGTSFDVQAGAILGRADECAVVLHDASVSRQHARLDCPGGVWTIVDLKSRNGLFVDGVRTSEALIGDGEEFRVGEVLLKFRAGVSTASAAVRSPARVAPVLQDASTVEDEITLEGDWDETVAANARSSARAPEPVEVSARAAVGPSLARQQATARLAAAGALPKGATAGARGILQYNRVEGQDGFLRAELAQQPLWIKSAVALVTLVLCAGLAWLAFRGVLMLKSAPQDPGAIEDSTDEAR